MQNNNTVFIRTDSSEPSLTKPEEVKRLSEATEAEILENYKKFLGRSELSQWNQYTPFYHNLENHCLSHLAFS